MNSEINKNNSSNNKLKAIISIGIFFTFDIIFSLLLVSMNFNINKLSNDSKIILSLIEETVLLLILFLIYKDEIIDNFKIYIKNIKNYLNKYIRYWFLALGLMYISNFIIIKITTDLAKNEQTVRTLFDHYPIMTLILGCIIAPITEELIFRLSIYKLINKYKYLFIIVSGLAFGCAHVLSAGINGWVDLLFLVPYSIPGFIMAYTLVDSDNIFVPISIHFIHNTFAFALQLINNIIK